MTLLTIIAIIAVVFSVGKIFFDIYKSTATTYVLRKNSNIIIETKSGKTIRIDRRKNYSKESINEFVESMHALLND